MVVHNQDPSEWLDLLSVETDTDRLAEPSVELRRTLLRRSTRVVRHRRCLRRFSLVGALAVCYLAGLASARLTGFVSVDGPTTVAQTGASGATADPSSSAAKESTTSSAGADPSTENTVAELSQNTSQNTKKPKRKAPSRFEWLRRVSDRYLYERGDITTAIRYYRKALDVATDEELAIAIDSDSWLLIALKQERIQEKRYANQST